MGCWLAAWASAEGVGAGDALPVGGLWCWQEAFRALVSLVKGPGKGYCQAKAARLLVDFAFLVGALIHTADLLQLHAPPLPSTEKAQHQAHFQRKCIED